MGIQRDNINLTNRYSFSYQIGRGDYVDLSTLKSVEVLKGPASTLYGSDALGGAISFRQLAPSDLLKEDGTYAVELPTYYDGANEGLGGAIKIAAPLSERLSGLFIVSGERGGDPATNADDKYINGGESS